MVARKSVSQLNRLESVVMFMNLRGASVVVSFFVVVHGGSLEGRCMYQVKTCREKRSQRE